MHISRAYLERVKRLQFLTQMPEQHAKRSYSGRAFTRMLGQLPSDGGERLILMSHGGGMLARWRSV